MVPDTNAGAWSAAKHALLRDAAGRIDDNPFFLGHLLAAYRELARIDDDGLAAELGCGREGLVRLALCRAPRDGAQFRIDLDRAATHAGADPLKLLPVVRQAQSFTAFRAADRADLLAAARDRAEAAPPADSTDGGGS